MKEDNSIEEKQEYVRKNILDKGYEANSFADYLVSKKGEEASDISLLTMSELRQEVKEFIQANELKKKKEEEEEEEEDKPDKKEEEKNENNKDNNDEEKIETEKEEEIKIKKNTIIKDYFKNENDEDNQNEENNKIIENKEKEKKEKKDKKEKKENKDTSKKESKKELIKESKKEPQKEVKKQEEPKNEEEFILPAEIYGVICPASYEDFKPMDNTPLSSVDNLIIRISNPEKVGGGFFTKTYVTYLISTNEPKLNVRRRYTDFVWFHQMLIDLYPYVVIPPIPKKMVGVDNLDKIFISKRMRYLEKFFKWLIQNPIIKNSKLFYDFLSIENDEDFTKKKSEYQKMTRPMNLIEFHSINNKMNLVVNKEREAYFQKISENTNYNEILLNNLSKSLKDLQFEFDILIDKIDQVKQNWEILYVSSTKYFEDINISTTYDKMSKLFMNWNESFKRINDLLSIDIREDFKYIKNNYRDMKNNIYNVEVVKEEYYRYEKFLRYKKDDLFNSGDVSRWELDPQEKSSPKSLAGDKFSALFKMCAKDTERVIQKKVYYGYYLNQLIEEYERLRHFYSKFYKDKQFYFYKTMNEIISEFNKHIIENFTSLVEDNNDKKK